MVINESGFYTAKSNDEVIRWVKRFKGKPQFFDDPEARGDKSGIRIDFPGRDDERYMQEAVDFKDISWERFFEILEDRGLDFVYKMNPDLGDDLSLCYRLVPRVGAGEGDKT